MRKSVLAFLAITVAKPLSAAEIITVEISGSATGTEFIEYSLVNPALWPNECANNDPLTQGCQITSPVTLSPFSGIVEAQSEDGIIFNFGDFLNLGPIDRRGYSGSARRISDGVFTEIDIVIEETSTPYPFEYDSTPFIRRTAQGSSFTLRQLSPVPVPEPATWALLLLGLFGIGSMMRLPKRGQTRVSYS